MKLRNHAFDLLCGVCIIRMIMLHVTQACHMSENDWWKEIMQWSYFFMSFFFFKAGYFNKSVDGDTLPYIKDKAKRLLVPYFVWGGIGNAVYFFFIFIMPSGNPYCKNLMMEHIWEASGFYGNGPCWFLFSFFMAYIVVHLMSKIPSFSLVKTKKHRYQVSILWTVLLFPYISYWLCMKENPLYYNLNNVFFGVFLFELGRIWRMALDSFKRKIIMSVSVVMLAIFAYLNAIYGGQYGMSGNTWEGDFFILLINIICVLCGLSGILLSIRIPRIPIINYIGEHSMVFFISHYVIINFYSMLRSYNVHVLRNHWDDYIILTVMIFSICFWLVPYVEKIPVLSGRFKNKPST